MAAMNKSEKPRILGLDFGDRTVGAAVSDGLGLTAQGLETIFRERPTHLRRTCARIEALIEEYDISRIVLGLPLNMDGSEGERAKKTREFGDALERRTGVPVAYQDERLTSVAAAELLSEAGIPAKDHKEKIDMVAAQLILEDYMENHQHES